MISEARNDFKVTAAMRNARLVQVRAPDGTILEIHPRLVRVRFRYLAFPFYLLLFSSCAQLQALLDMLS